MLPAWLADEVAAVPDFEVFADADGLEDGLQQIAGRSTDVASVRRVGTSRLGQPLTCLSVGDGPAQAVVFGLPHPNEPIGGLTALHLAERLSTDERLRNHLGHRWHIIACIDPDGLRLNEGWLKGPFTREHYSRNFYRPAGAEQVEWTFPVDYKQAYFDAVLPETLALMRLIDETEPALMGSLHNSEQGGAYYYLSRPEPDLHPLLQSLPESFGIPLDRGEPESATSKVLADGVFSALSLREMYDAAEASGDPLPLGAGETSDAYASRHGTLTIVSELPYWSDPRGTDVSPTDVTYAAALDAQANGIDELGQVMAETIKAVDADLVTDSAFLRATRFFGPAMRDMPPTIRRRAAELSSRRPATVAEVATLADLVHCFRLRYAGMLLRLLDAELAVGNTTVAIRRSRVSLAERYDEWCALAAESDRATALPIRSLVATQYGAMLAAARHLYTHDPCA